MATKQKTQDTADQTSETARIVGNYFAAVSRNEADAALHHYGPTATGSISGIFADRPREQIAEFFAGLHAAIPDFRLEVLDLIAQDERATVRWRMTGTFAGPGYFQGFAPTGGRFEIHGVDFVWVRGGQIGRLEAYTDGATIARQIGALPPAGSAADQGMAKVFNARTGLVRRMGTTAPQQIADGVWVIRGGFPLRTMNVYLVKDGDGVLVFDAGIKGMTRGIAAAGASLGGITRVVLGHAHPDHRGAAPGLGVPVYCHELDRADAEGDGGAHYFDFTKLSLHGRLLLKPYLNVWDGGPVEIAGTVAEGDEIAGFEVVHLPGHAPGLIGLWRASDRLALVSDCFYTLDPQTGIHGKPRLPHAAFNHDTEQARASIRKLAALEPSAAWAGHAEPVTGDVRTQLETAAATT
jgi:glyoxylase-like metal-dependent hydrolase (beta-lactamase superfamily II)/predicted ester cyclase